VTGPGASRSFLSSQSQEAEKIQQYLPEAEQSTFNLMLSSDGAVLRLEQERIPFV
jgi:hypothetical protein